MKKHKKLHVKGHEVNIIEQNDEDYISLTDMSSGFNEGSSLIGKWITNKNTLEYLGIWESLKNPSFNYPEFGVIEKEAGTNRFIMSVGQWINRTKAFGLIVKVGRYGGTFAHKDIAFHYAMWLSPEFQIYLINEFQRLKEEEQKQLGWSAKRELTKINYRIHTDAIKQHLIPKELTAAETSVIYANEADVLNVALFGMTAKQWREANQSLKGNIRDYANINELICLANMENLNSVFIKDNMPQQERLIRLNKIAIQQMQVLCEAENRRFLK